MARRTGSSDGCAMRQDQRSASIRNVSCVLGSMWSTSGRRASTMRIATWDHGCPPIDIMVKVLVPSGYAGQFNMPRSSSVHEITPADFIGRQQQLWRPLGGIALWRPGNRADVVHTFNRVPLHRRRSWMVTFEDYLPRTYGRRAKRVSDAARSRLADAACGRIIAMSQWALGIFGSQHESWSGFPDLLGKTEVLYPAIAERVTRPKSYVPGEVLRLVFVGSSWATKGAPVAARLAVLAEREKLPLEIHVVSSLSEGYADDPRRELYDPDKMLITGGPVVYHGALQNDRVHALLERSHILLLPSLGDTFGYSVLEGFAHALPALVSNTNALVEVVHADVNGLVVHLPTNRLGSWTELKKGWEYMDAAYTSMAEQALEQVERVVSGEIDYEELSAGALRQLRDHHDPVRRNRMLDALYTELGSADANA